MSIKKNIPQISALKLEVERMVGYKFLTHAHFVDLVERIDKKLREHISETTLERVWGYSTRHYDNVSVHTLDLLCRFIDKKDWVTFCDLLSRDSLVESGLFIGDSINTAELHPGVKLLIGWLPDRLCTIKYLGNHFFEVEHSVNSSIEVGDTFTCFILQKGRPLYLDNYRKRKEEEQVIYGARYAIGQNNGLTTLEIIK